MDELCQKKTRMKKRPNRKGNELTKGIDAFWKGFYTQIRVHQLQLPHSQS